jgi:actin related protein 2/3 complex subunit 3
VACGCPLLPFSGLPGAADVPTPDILEECLELFRPNVLFHTFDIEGPADRTLLYFSLFATQLLKTVARAKGIDEAASAANTLALSHFPCPGDVDFKIPGIFPAPSAPEERTKWAAWFKAARGEFARRLIAVAFRNGEADPMWTMWAKYKFIGKSL